MSSSTNEPSTSAVEPRDGEVPDSQRQIVFVAGSGRSGTSTFAVILQQLGMYVPQPEVPPDATNPKGFGEPQWAVVFHDRMLERLRVQVSDARPRAWFLTARACTREQHRETLYEWLTGHFGHSPSLIVKDPRLSWFLPLWQSTAIRCGATPSFVTMLRPPAEVVGSKQIYYGGRVDNLNRTAAWLNMMLHTERATRGSQRAFVRYHDLLDDWTRPVFRVGEALGLRPIRDAEFRSIREVHHRVDPTLRRVRMTLDDVDLPPRLRQLTEETWQNLSKLAEPEGDSPETQATLDHLRLAYIQLYEEAEGIAMSSVLMARPLASKSSAQAKEVPRANSRSESSASLAHNTDLTGPDDSSAARPPPADAIPHRVRAAIPAGWRRTIRRIVPRRTRSPR